MDAAKDVPLLNESCTPIATSAPYSVLWRAISLLGCLLLACGISIGIAATCSSSYPIILSHAFIAFALGLRHAVDCDHLAAIDNVTRQLLAHGQWPVSVGFWFASGHSSVVVLLTAVLAGGYTWVWQAAGNSGNLTEDISLVAGLISILILGAIGMLNAYVAVGLFSDLAELKKQSSGAQDEQLRSNAESTLRTALSTIPFVKRVFEHVNAPHKMFGVGFLFGLSFDTATQVGLIGLAAMTGTSGHVPPLMVMIFPICFSCGMCLVDTSNGLLMLVTYSWSAIRPMQKLFYNFVVTSMSAGIALIICSLELMQVVAQEASLQGPFWTFIANVDMASVGYSIMAMFAFILIVAAIYARGICQCRCSAGSEFKSSQHV